MGVADTNPISVLQKEISHFKRFQKTIETKEGMYIPADKKEEVEANLLELHGKLDDKIKEFELAINILTSKS